MKVVYTIVQDTDFDAFASQALRLQPVDTKLFMRSCQDMCQASCVTISLVLTIDVRCNSTLFNKVSFRVLRFWLVVGMYEFVNWPDILHKQ